MIPLRKTDSTGHLRNRSITRHFLVTMWLSDCGTFWSLSLLFFFCFSRTEDQTQGLALARPLFYHWAKSPTDHCLWKTKLKTVTQQLAHSEFSNSFCSQKSWPVNAKRGVSPGFMVHSPEWNPNENHKKTASVTSIHSLPQRHISVVERIIWLEVVSPNILRPSMELNLVTAQGTLSKHCV